MPKKTYLNTSQAFSIALSHPYTVVGPIRPIRVANVQEFFSLKMSYDVLLCFTSMFYHRHAENVLSKGGHCVWAIRVISLALA